RGGRRLTAADRLTRLFESYAAHRPRMLCDWWQGKDTDGAGGDLTTDLAWQPELWRRLRAQTGVPSPAERLEPACVALRDSPGLVDLPERLSLFGPTRLSTAQLEVLAALAQARDVHLWLPHPSATLWDKVAEVAEDAALADRPRQVRRRTDPTADLPRNRLLASLGRDAREMQLRLASCAVETRHHHHPLERQADTMLGRLQTALRDDAAPATQPPTLRPDDRSLQVHACHGPARQVEVLRDVLVGLLADDPTLEPRDVLVMCPDIEQYAPLISATFGLEEEAATAHHPGHRLRVRLADRSLRSTNPLLDTLASLLELADARVTASEVLDLASLSPVRRRFRLSDDDMERLQEWVSASGVRWGLDAAHRSPFGLGKVPQNTWRAGLDRILLGAAMAEDELRWVGLALPLDDVDSNDVDLAGRLAELLDRLADVLDGMAGERPLSDWLRVLGLALDSLTAVRESDAWQSAQARRELAQVAADSGTRATSLPLSLADVRALFADRLQGRPTRANFRTGNLTMCSMVPMRSVPHRVVCLLGLDDGHFPRGAGVDGDDILARDSCVGERDLRSEDRQLLLDAVLAAREQLVVLYTGADRRTNAHRPPAVPVGEILDAVDTTVASPDDRRPSEHLLVHHPLQPFDARNFTDGALGRHGPFSFDRQALSGARRAARTREQPKTFLATPLPPPEATRDLALEDLAWFLEHPARGFVRQRLGVTLLREQEELADDLAVELDGLQQWGIGDRLLRARLAGAGVDTCVQGEWRRGVLPPGALGARVLDEVMAQVEPLVLAAREHSRQPARTVDVAPDLGGRRLTGTVGNVVGDTVLRVEYSRLAPKHRLRAWTQLLALTAAHPGRPWTAVTIGRYRKGVARSTLGPLDGDLAREVLARLVDLHQRGLCAPLPMATKTSAVYAQKRAGGMSHVNALARAEQEWTGGRFDGEQADAAHELVWGRAAPVGVLLEEPPRADEQGPTWPGDESTRFGALARRLWSPLLAAEQGVPG
ncbi:MAG TPA: exodeoxyribonuclease V subunit gamma, partial [Nocardioidaceae bacterium]|nr:exodeoxyribonuclease V subunit gamma [Nocardioidaceae bacterium]